MNLKYRVPRAGCAATAWVFCVFVLAADAAAQPAEVSVTSPIKVMSFNIRFGTANDGPNHWKHRDRLVGETIAVFDPDLLGVQEALDFQIQFLREQLGQFRFFGRGREREAEQGEFCGIFFRQERFHQLSGGHFWLSETPDEPGSKSWDSSLPRMVTWVHLKDRADADREFIFANTHFDHRGSQARQRSSELIRSRLIAEYPDLPLIICGDFNASVNDDPYRILTANTDAYMGRSLIDSFRAINPASDREGTFSAWNGRRTGGRIDWILHTPEFLTVNAAINYHNAEGRYPSDHYPVQAVLKLR